MRHMRKYFVILAHANELEAISAIKFLGRISKKNLSDNNAYCTFKEYAYALLEIEENKEEFNQLIEKFSFPKGFGLVDYFTVEYITAKFAFVKYYSEFLKPMFPEVGFAEIKKHVE